MCCYGTVFKSKTCDFKHDVTVSNKPKNEMLFARDVAEMISFHVYNIRPELDSFQGYATIRFKDTFKGILKDAIVDIKRHHQQELYSEDDSTLDGIHYLLSFHYLSGADDNQLAHMVLDTSLKWYGHHEERYPILKRLRTLAADELIGNQQDNPQ